MKFATKTRAAAAAVSTVLGLGLLGACGASHSHGTTTVVHHHAPAGYHAPASHAHLPVVHTHAPVVVHSAPTVIHNHYYGTTPPKRACKILCKKR